MARILRGGPELPLKISLVFFFVSVAVIPLPKEMAASEFTLPEDLADWERTQAKTFAKWANLYLAKRGLCSGRPC